jgi:hypothetical protein
MSAIDEQILRATKEILVKFIEVGRVYPATFNDTFMTVHRTITKAVKDPDSMPEQPAGKKK